VETDDRGLRVGEHLHSPVVSFMQRAPAVRQEREGAEGDRDPAARRLLLRQPDARELRPRVDDVRIAS